MSTPSPSSPLSPHSLTSFPTSPSSNPPETPHPRWNPSIVHDPHPHNRTCKCHVCLSIREWRGRGWDVGLLLKYATKALLHLYGWEHGADLIRFTEERVRVRSEYCPSTSTKDSQSNSSLDTLHQPKPQNSQTPPTSLTNKRREVLAKLSFWTEDYYSQKREREWMKEVDLWLMRDLAVREPRLLERVLKVARKAYLDVWV